MGGNALFIRAVRGPVLLIVLGTLFALDYFWRMPFHRTWPVLLIVFGLFKLAEKMAGPGHSGPGATPGGLGAI